MMIKNAEFIFDLTIYRDLKQSKQLSVLNGRIEIAGLVLVQSWTVTIQK